MKYLTIIALFFLMVSPAMAVEIYTGSKHFKSLEEYLGADAPKAIVPSVPVGEIPPAAPRKMDPNERKIQELSYNSGVNRMVVSFEQNWANPKAKFVAGSRELENKIEALLKDEKDPTLLISDPNKLRIMTYHSKDGVPAPAVSVDKSSKK